MPPISIIKKTAKNSLKDKWPMSIALAFTILAMLSIGIAGFMLINSFLSAFLGKLASTLLALVPIIFLWQFLGVPLLYGTLRWSWFTSLNEELPFYEIFYYFGSGQNYIRAISLGFRIFLRIILIIAVCFAPSIIIAIICMPQLYNILNFSMPYFVSSLWALGNMLEIFGATISAILLLRYLSAPILLINENNISPQEALNLSCIISKCANGKTLSFLLSFAFWLLASILVIPLLYAIPYFLVAYSIYSKHLIDNYNKIIEINNSQIYPNYQPNYFK